MHASHAALKAMLVALTMIDVAELKTYPDLPNLYDSGVRYEEEPLGQEDWQDILTSLKLKVADCLPVSTLVLLDDYTFAPLGSLVPGDRIMGEAGLTTVKAHLNTGKKRVLGIDLDNGKTLRCTGAHRLFLATGEEIRASSVREGHSLRGLRSPRLRVRHVRDLAEEPCADIETDTGRFYLPESDAVVHNCEDLSAWRCAELQVRQGIQAWPCFTYRVRPGGGYLYHIQVRYPDGRVEDPSRTLGMR